MRAATVTAKRRMAAWHHAARGRPAPPDARNAPVVGRHPEPRLPAPPEHRCGRI